MSGASQWSCILWDMDGTLIDASVGILERLRITHAHFGIPSPTEADLINWIGPPMSESFRKNTGFDEDTAQAAVEFYRGLHHDEPVGYGTHLIDGVADLVAEVARAGVPQAIASSKPEEQVVPIAKHFGIADDFVTMAGASSIEAVRSTKAEVVREALRRLNAVGVDTSNPVLIGDRHHDVEGAAAEGVPTIFVTWGFSSPHESEGAVATASTVDELRALILR